MGSFDRQDAAKMHDEGRREVDGARVLALCMAVVALGALLRIALALLLPPSSEKEEAPDPSRVIWCAALVATAALVIVVLALRRARARSAATSAATSVRDAHEQALRSAVLRGGATFLTGAVAAVAAAMHAVEGMSDHGEGSDGALLLGVAWGAAITCAVSALLWIGACLRLWRLNQSAHVSDPEKNSGEANAKR